MTYGSALIFELIINYSTYIKRFLKFVRTFRCTVKLKITPLLPEFRLFYWSGNYSTIYIMNNIVIPLALEPEI